MKNIKSTPIKNLPSYATNYAFIVAREVEGEWWFWGAYNDAFDANMIAEAINGDIFLKN